MPVPAVRCERRISRCCPTAPRPDTRSPSFRLLDNSNAGGLKEILFPDGAARRVLADGCEVPLPSAAGLSAEARRPRPVDLTDSY
jgi:hypothetical protein